MNVRRELETVTERDIAIGTVYATLDRFEAKGLVTSARPDAVVDAPSRRALLSHLPVPLWKAQGPILNILA